MFSTTLTEFSTFPAESRPSILHLLKYQFSLVAMGLLYTDQLTWTLWKVLTNYNFERIKKIDVIQLSIYSNFYIVKTISWIWFRVSEHVLREFPQSKMVTCIWLRETPSSCPQPLICLRAQILRLSVRSDPKLLRKSYRTNKRFQPQLFFWHQ